MTTATTHLCAVEACRIEIPTELLMCGRHWRRVPQAIRRQVNEAFRRYGRTPTIENLLELRACQQAAAESVK